MGRSKIVYGGTTLIDLTADTVASNNLLTGYTAHGADGEQVSGNVSFVTYYTGTTAPSASLGSDGDIYLKVVT